MTYDVDTVWGGGRFVLWGRGVVDKDKHKQCRERERMSQSPDIERINQFSSNTALLKHDDPTHSWASFKLVL